MDDSISFYERLGFSMALRYSDPAGEFEISHLKLHDAFLEIWCYKSAIEPPESSGSLGTDLPRIGVKHFALKVPSVEEARRYIAEQSIPVEVELRDGNTGVRYFFVKDPSGNLLEILEDQRSL
jgi:glyoxylase I family protein